MKESPIFSKTYDLLLWVSNHSAHFPKSERFRLAKRIDDTVFRLHEQLLIATIAGKTTDALQKADFELMRLRFLFRLAKDSHLTSQSQYEHCMCMLIEIGKLLGGWIKSRDQSHD